jgi:hypothetical protein
MTTPTPPIPPQDPYNYKTESVEKDKKEREPFEPEEGKYLARFASLVLSLFGDLLGAFRRKGQRELKKMREAALRDALILLKAQLEALLAQDRSQDREYAERLSQIWNEVERLRPAPHLEEMLSEIGRYPPGAEFSLGYYLSRKAGGEWLPFPLMEILGDLHREGTRLQRWIDAISASLFAETAL